MPWTCKDCGCECGLLGCSNPKCSSIEKKKLLNELKKISAYREPEYFLEDIVDWVIADRKRIVEPLEKQIKELVEELAGIDI